MEEDVAVCNVPTVTPPPGEEMLFTPCLQKVFKDREERYRQAFYAREAEIKRKIGKRDYYIMHADGARAIAHMLSACRARCCAPADARVTMRMPRHGTCTAHAVSAHETPCRRHDGCFAARAMHAHAAMPAAMI